MDFMYELGVFAAKSGLIVLSVLIILVVLVVLISRNRSRHRRELSVEKLNEHYEWLKDALQSQMLPWSLKITRIKLVQFQQWPL